MKNAKKIGGIGQILMIIGSILFIVELTGHTFEGLVTAITGIYAVAIVLMLIGWIGTRDERRAQKESKDHAADNAA